MLNPGDVHHGRAWHMLEQREQTFRSAWKKRRKPFVHGPQSPSRFPKRFGSTHRPRSKHGKWLSKCCPPLSQWR